MNKHPSVDKFFEKSTNPLKEEMSKVREIILSAHPDIEEAIKWQQPTFMYKGNIASFMNAKKLVSLMFHQGALIGDKHELLEGDGKVARVARFHNMEEVKKKKKALQAAIKAWVKMKDAK